MRREPLPLRIAVGALILLAGASPPAGAQLWPVSLSRELPLGHETEPSPAVAAAPSGELFVVRRTSVSAGIVGQFFDAEGEPLGPAQPLATDAGTFDVASSSHGEFLAVWDRRVSDFERSIVGRWFSSQGSPLGPELTINTVSPRTIRLYPSVGCAEDDRCVVAWLAAEPSLPGHYFVARFFTPAGVPSGAEKQLATGPYDTHSNLAIAVAADGRFALTWLRRRLANPPPVLVNDALLRTFAADGTPFGAPVLLGSPCLFPAGATCVDSVQRVSAAWNGDGEVLAVWGKAVAVPSGSANHNLLARRFAVDGSPSGDLIGLARETSGVEPDLSWNAELERFAVLWNWQAAGPATGGGVKLRLLGPDGTPTGAELPATESQDFLIRQAALAFGGTSLWTVWGEVPPLAPLSRALHTLRWRSGEPTCSGPFVDGDVPCVPLLSGRFKAWAAFRRPDHAPALAPAFAATDRAGFVYFNSVFNPEVAVKMLDGRPVNQRFWFFWGAMSNQEYAISIYDRATGATRVYYNPEGKLASAADVRAFADTAAEGSSSVGGEALACEELAAPEAAFATQSHPGLCQPSATRLCLQAGRFEVEVDWRDFSGGSGPARAVPLTDQGGYFTFFNPANVELALKILDGTAINGHWWLFYASLSNVEFTVRVTDHEGHATREYHNPPSTMRSVVDLEAF